MKIALLESLGCSQGIIKENAARLAALGHELKVFSRTEDIEVLKGEVEDADVIMLANMPLPAEVLAAVPAAKFIDVAFTGVDHIPVAEAKKRGIAISNASGYADEAVAELCISLMIQLLRQLGEAEKRVRTGGTKAGLSARIIQGKTVGIIGAGAIGKRLAAILKAFGATVVAHNRRPVHDPAIDKNVSLDELLETSDIISVHCPLTSETKGLIGAPQLARMKKSAILINAGRGPVVDNAALAEALNSGEIAGAGCDVFDIEPPLPANYPLLAAKNAVLTPHLGFYSEESLNDRAKIVFENLYAWLDGKQINAI